MLVVMATVKRMVMPCWMHGPGLAWTRVWGSVGVVMMMTMFQGSLEGLLLDLKGGVVMGGGCCMKVVACSDLCDCGEIRWQLKHSLVVAPL